MSTNLREYKWMDRNYTACKRIRKQVLLQDETTTMSTSKCVKHSTVLFKDNEEKVNKCFQNTAISVKHLATIPDRKRYQREIWWFVVQCDEVRLQKHASVLRKMSPSEVYEPRDVKPSSFHKSFLSLRYHSIFPRFTKAKQLLSFPKSPKTGLYSFL